MNLAEKYIKKRLSSLKRVNNIPNFRSGDTIKVYNKIVDEHNSRVQIFEGICIARNNNKLSSTFKVKKISYGMCFEKTFPLYSPLITKIELLKQGKVRRTKLYYMRELVGKAARVQERRSWVSFKSSNKS